MSIVTIRLDGKVSFSNICNLYMKVLPIVVTIRLNKKAVFVNMCNLCIKELRIVVSIVTIRLNGKKPSPI